MEYYVKPKFLKESAEVKKISFPKFNILIYVNLNLLKSLY